MDRLGRSLLTLLAFVFCMPGVLSAQEASITGTVKDSVGAVLPGVTVAASSPALIEKVREVITDGTGQYRIEGLRPGTYAVSFTLQGFSVVQRSDIELVGSFAATVNAELRVGAIEETVTVSGETPVVDLQSVKQQRVLSAAVLEALPSARLAQALSVFVPGVNEGGTHDVGGTGLLGQQQPTVHGSGNGDFRLQLDGFNMGGLYPSFAGFQANLGSTQEVNVNSAASLADQWSGGVLLNVIPKEGGNELSGSFFASGANSDWQSNNFTDRARAKGLQRVNNLKEMHDVNPAIGGPIKRDKLWFYASARSLRTRLYPGGAFHNKNAGLKDVWTYEPDLSRPGNSDAYSYGWDARGTWQVTPKNKIGVSFSYQRSCYCAQMGFGTPTTGGALVVMPEAAPDSSKALVPRVGYTTTWSNPLTSRLLLDAGVQIRYEKNGNSVRPPDGDPRLDLIPVLDASLGIAYHGPIAITPTIYQTWSAFIPQTRASVSYVTGAHALKIGFTQMYTRGVVINGENNFGLRYAFNNGTPISLTQAATPFPQDQRAGEQAVFAQDRWGFKRLTVTLGARFDRYKTWVPAMHFGPGVLVPTRNFDTAPATYFNLKEVAPRMAVVYDLFGNGRTAVKASSNRFLNQAGGSTGVFNGNPALTLANSVTRNWNDANRNFVPDCDLTNQAANGECSAGNPSFGSQIRGTVIDPETLGGWGNRGYNWEFSVGVQQEVLPRVSVDMGYFRRVHGNLLVTDNRTLSPGDYDPYTLTAPADLRLPNGGGYVVPGLFDLKPTRVGLPVDNYQTFASNYGKQRSHWNGVDVNVTARPRRGVLAAGGFSTGRAFTDNCDVVVKLDNPSPLYCRSENNFLTQVKGYAAYMIPKLEVQVAGTFQSVPGPALTAEVVYTTAQAAVTLGRPLSANAATVTRNVVIPGTMFGERLNQLDLRVGKVLRYGRSSTGLNFDLFNAFNADTILGLSSQYAIWQRATAIVQGRIAKVSVQFDF